MKHKIVLFYLLTLLSLNLTAQTITSTTENKLKWLSIQKWYIKDYAKSVISFEGAFYPAEDQLPYFSKRISIDPAFLYSVLLENVTYSNLSGGGCFFF